MRDEHLNSDALLRASYGTAEEREARHAALCAECGAAVALLDARRAQARAAGTVEDLPDAFWLRHRRAIRAAADVARGSRPLPRRAPALAVLALLLLGFLLLWSPAPQVPPAMVPSPEDEKLLADICLALERDEARAVAPMAELVPVPAGPAGKEKKQ